MSRTFTLEEAQMLVPVLGALLLRAREAAVRSNELEQAMQQLSQRIFLSGGLHVDVAAAATRRAEREKALREAKAALDEIEEIGAQLGDSDEGALEFPCMRDGRIVLLSWALGDERIERWREAEDGSPMQSLDGDWFGRDAERPN